MIGEWWEEIIVVIISHTVRKIRGVETGFSKRIKVMQEEIRYLQRVSNRYDDEGDKENIQHEIELLNRKIAHEEKLKALNMARLDKERDFVNGNNYEFWAWAYTTVRGYDAAKLKSRLKYLVEQKYLKI